MEAFGPGKVYERIRDASEQGAAMVVIDLCLDSITYSDAREKALEAIEDGLFERGRILILDWHGDEHVV